MCRKWYWTVLLLLLLMLMHSGCRALEVIQLLKTDIRQVDGIWCLDLVGHGEGRHLKNRESIRKVPVHSSMITAGVVDWCTQQEGPRLFPLLHSYGVIKTTQWYSAMLEKGRMKRSALTLHSLRHTVTQKLAKARTYPPLKNRILGHAMGTSVEERVYMGSMKYSVKELSEALGKVSFPDA